VTTIAKGFFMHSGLMFISVAAAKSSPGNSRGFPWCAGAYRNYEKVISSLKKNPSINWH